MTRRYLFSAGLTILLGAAVVTAQRPAGPAGNGGEGGAESRDMRLVGHSDLQGRSAYQPEIKRQGDRWIAYVGHHGGNAMNPLTGREEANGTSIVDVTDPRSPKYLAHIPGQALEAGGTGESGGAQMVRSHRQRPARDAQELVGMRHRHRVPRLRPGWMARATHGQDL
jgi:hypothetical protein